MNTEYKKRLYALQAYMEKEEIEAAMITNPANVFYYTGFLSEPHERFMALVIDTRSSELRLFVPALDKDLAANHSTVENIVPISDEENPFEILQQRMSDDIHTFALEKNFVNIFRYEHLQQVFSKATFKDIQPFINSERKRKSMAEVEQIKKPIHIIEKVLEEGIKKVKVGMTESELVAELEYLMRKFGADGPSFSTIVLAGEKADRNVSLL